MKIKESIQQAIPHYGTTQQKTVHYLYTQKLNTFFKFLKIKVYS